MIPFWATPEGYETFIPTKENIRERNREIWLEACRILDEREECQDE